MADKNLTLKYGSDRIPVTMPAGTDILEINNPGREIDRTSFTAKLTSLLPVRRNGSLAIVVSDKTRLCGYGEYLPWLIEAAGERGYTAADITFYIAYGTHPRQTDEESRKAYGDIFDQYRFIHHDCNDLSKLVTLGKTAAGTDITVRKEITESEAVILFGAISHHYFAGYGGGRKLIFPGLAARDAIYNNHKLFIDFEKRRLDPGCQSGRLEGNPVAVDLEEIDSYFPSKIIVSGILDKSGSVTRLMIGSSYEEFVEACKLYDSFYRKRDGKLYDLVVASSGGYPKDINFIQSHKSIHNSASFVKNGGKLILLAECRDGLGNEQFIKIFENNTENAVKSLAEHYSGNGGTALSMMEKSRRINIFMVTSLDEATCRKMGVTKIYPEEIGDIVDSVAGEKALIENGSIIFR